MMAQGMVIYLNVSLLPERELTLSCPISQLFHLITLSILLGALKKCSPIYYLGFRH